MASSRSITSNRWRQSVDPNDDQRVALADPFQHTSQNRPRAVPARGLLLVDFGAACGFQGLRLGQGGLILGPRPERNRSGASKQAVCSFIYHY